MTLLTNKEYFNYPMLVKQLSKITKEGKIIPHFNPYLDKTDKQTNKDVCRALESCPPSGKPEGVDSEAWSRCLLTRFDSIVRKVMKINVKESTENVDEETINMVWFFTLDSIFKIKQEQIHTLEAIRDSQVEKAKQTGLLLSEIQA